MLFVALLSALSCDANRELKFSNFPWHFGHHPETYRFTSVIQHFRPYVSPKWLHRRPLPIDRLFCERTRPDNGRKKGVTWSLAETSPSPPKLPAMGSKDLIFSLRNRDFNAPALNSSINISLLVREIPQFFPAKAEKYLYFYRNQKNLREIVE
jgi:hypothetical protein